MRGTISAKHRFFYPAVISGHLIFENTIQLKSAGLHRLA